MRTIPNCSVLPQEHESLTQQCDCQRELSHGLAMLTTLVNKSDITQDDRSYLLAPIVHLCHHIAGETREIKAEMRDRRN